jgi:hypothetical protein
VLCWSKTSFSSPESCKMSVYFDLSHVSLAELGSQDCQVRQKGYWSYKAIRLGLAFQQSVDGLTTGGR